MIGIHQDNTEISSVMLIERVDVLSGGETRLWSLETPMGNYDEGDFPGKKGLLLDHALQGPFETVIFNDRLVKGRLHLISLSKSLDSSINGGVKGFSCFFCRFSAFQVFFLQPRKTHLKSRKGGEGRKVKVQTFTEGN